ncbi:hypothetical protein [Thermoplasma volcanium]|nr:hypothetical protein [Thermoplasma volcanium]
MKMAATDTCELLNFWDAKGIFAKEKEFNFRQGQRQTPEYSPYGA